MVRKSSIAGLALLALLLALYVYSLPGRPPDIDDAWIGEHAYWLAKEGYVKSELMRGITNQDEYLIVHHKLLTLHGALFIKIFGFSLYTLKSISLVYFIIFIGLFYCYTAGIAKIFKRKDLVISLVLMFSFPWIFKYSFLYRPEIMLMTFGFISFILLQKSLLQIRYGQLLPLLSGMVAGLAVVTHLNGLVVAGAGFLYLLIKREWRAVALFTVGSVIILPIYFYDFNSTYGFSYWWYQMTESPALDSVPDATIWLQPLLNLVDEHRRFFHNPRIIVFTAFAFTVIAFKLKFLWKNHREIFLYLILSMLLLGLIGAHKSRQYILIYFPYLVILTTLSLKDLFRMPSGGEWKGNEKAAIITAFLLMFIYIGAGNFYNFILATDKFSAQENRQLSLKYFGPRTEKENIIAPMTFIFNEIEHYNRIQGEVCYTELQKENIDIYGDGFLDEAKSFDVKHIFLTPYYSNLLGVSNYKEGSIHAGYRVLQNIEGEIIMTRTAD